MAMSADNYPARPIRIVVPYVAGGNIDLTARAVTPGLTESLSQPVLVDNRGGASGRIGTESVARAAPDGYTLLLGSSSPLTITPAFYKTNYDPLRDFATTSMISIVPLVLSVHPSIPARNVRELIALAKSRPGRLTMGSAGTGGTSHLAGELFQIHRDAHSRGAHSNDRPARDQRELRPARRGSDADDAGGLQ
jgi:tripartite-type tricarboxylate transporter receptor subunit TctC